jgi:hypothetical protein
LTAVRDEAGTLARRGRIKNADDVRGGLTWAVKMFLAAAAIGLDEHRFRMPAGIEPARSSRTPAECC